eukprot:763136-Hanusia_phi.AAC.2
MRRSTIPSSSSLTGCRILDKARLALLPSPRFAADICISSPHGHLASLPGEDQLSSCCSAALRGLPRGFFDTRQAYLRFTLT